jgi:hypothetical protein
MTQDEKDTALRTLLAASGCRPIIGLARASKIARATTHAACEVDHFDGAALRQSRGRSASTSA